LVRPFGLEPSNSLLWRTLFITHRLKDALFQIETHTL
jgi:hypothetical protein